METKAGGSDSAVSSWDYLPGLGKPSVKNKDAIAAAWKVFQVRASSCKELPSERDRNFLLEEKGTRRKLVLKVANQTESDDVLDMQNQCLGFLAQNGFTEVEIPRALDSREGHKIGRFTVTGKEKGAKSAAVTVRLLTFVPGELLANCASRTSELVESLGSFVGRVDAAMSSFSHPAARRKMSWDLARGPETVDAYRGGIVGTEQQALVEALVDWHRRTVMPSLPTLRVGVIHSDFNDHNVLTDKGRVTGAIDFGDIVESQVVNNVSIAAAYCMLGAEDPIGTAAAVLRGYLAAFPLSAPEIKAVLPLVGMRLCASVSMAVHNAKMDPGNKYLLVSQRPAWELMGKLHAMGLEAAQAQLLGALSPVADVPAHPLSPGGRFQKARASNQLSLNIPATKSTPQGPPSPPIEATSSQQQVEKRLERMMSNNLTLDTAVPAKGGHGALPPSPRLEQTPSPAEMDAKFGKLLGDAPAVRSLDVGGGASGADEQPPSPTVEMAPTPAQMDAKFERLMSKPRMTLAPAERVGPPSPTVEMTPSAAQLDAQFDRLLSKPRVTLSVPAADEPEDVGPESPAAEEVMNKHQLDAKFERLMSGRRVLDMPSRQDDDGEEEEAPPSPTLEMAPTAAQLDAKFDRLMSVPRLQLKVSESGAAAANGGAARPPSPRLEVPPSAAELDAKFGKLLGDAPAVRSLDVGGGASGADEQPPSPTVEMAPTPAQMDAKFERLMSKPRMTLAPAERVGPPSPTVEMTPSAAQLDAQFDRLLSKPRVTLSVPAADEPEDVGPESPAAEEVMNKHQLDAKFERLMSGRRVLDMPSRQDDDGEEEEAPPSPTLEMTPTAAQLDAKFDRLMSVPRLQLKVSESGAAAANGGAARPPSPRLEVPPSAAELDAKFGKLLGDAPAVRSLDVGGGASGADEQPPSPTVEMAPTPAQMDAKFERLMSKPRMTLAPAERVGPPSPTVEMTPSAAQLDAQFDRLLSKPRVTLSVPAADEPEDVGPESPAAEEVMNKHQLDAKFERLMSGRRVLDMPSRQDDDGEEEEAPPSPTLEMAPTAAQLDAKFDRLMSVPRLQLKVSESGAAAANGGAARPPSPRLEVPPSAAELDAKFGKLLGDAPAVRSLDVGGGASGADEQPPSPTVEMAPTPAQMDAKFERLMSKPRMTLAPAERVGPPSPTVEMTPSAAQLDAQFDRLLSKPRVTLSVPAADEPEDVGPESPAAEEVMNKHQLDAKFERLMSGRRVLDMPSRQDDDGEEEEAPPSPTLEMAPTAAQLDAKFDRLMSVPRLQLKVSESGAAAANGGAARPPSPRLEVPPSAAELDAKFGKLLGDAPAVRSLDVGGGASGADEQPPSPTVEMAPTPAQMDAKFERLMSKPRVALSAIPSAVPTHEREVSAPDVEVTPTREELDAQFDALMAASPSVAGGSTRAPPETPSKSPKDGSAADPLSGMTGDEIMEVRGSHVGRNLSVSYDEPLHIVRGEGQFLYSVTGEKYLDCANNVAHVGHCHPDVVAATCEQLARLNTNTRYLSGGLAKYVTELVGTLPAPLEVVFLVCSGSEANDLALRLARAATGGASHVACLGSGYYGHTGSLVDISPYKFDGAGGEGRKPWVHILPAPDTYRGLFLDGSVSATAAVAEMAAAQDEARLAAFFGESVLGCGGQVVLPDGYMREVYNVVRAAGGVCVADEVQTGFGRVGTHMWAFETQGVVPDIVTMGKPAGNGYPLAAVVTTRAVADRFHTGMEYFNTFGGSNVACAAGSAVLDVIKRDKLMANADDVGGMLRRELRSLAAQCPIVGDVRGLGLFMGIEIVIDKMTKRPAPAHAHWVVQRMQRRGVLLSTDGPYHNVIKFKPPMCFSRADGVRLVRDLRAVLLRELDEATSARLYREDLAGPPGPADATPGQSVALRRPPSMSGVRSRMGPALSNIMSGWGTTWRDRVVGGMRQVHNIPRVVGAVGAVLLAHGGRSSRR